MGSASQLTQPVGSRQDSLPDAGDTTSGAQTEGMHTPHRGRGLEKLSSGPDAKSGRWTLLQMSQLSSIWPRKTLSYRRKDCRPFSAGVVPGTEDGEEPVMSISLRNLQSRERARE